MDKNKIIEAAAKLVAKGAYDKAIKEYRRILDADPKDVRVLQKMGELYQKKNDSEQAATYFTKVAENYSSDGFFLKAVALYKQVLKLNPSLLEINLRLAELHQQLQLVSEATSYYQIVAQQHEKSGNIKASLDTLKKIIELDPENVSSRIKLGEMYARGHMRAEAGDEFRRAAEHLKRNGRMEEYQRVVDRLSSLDSDDVTLAREVAQGYLAKGDAKRAIAKLQQCFKANPRDEQTLGLLAEAFAAIGQLSKTISVYKELAKVYASENRTAEVNQLWARIEQLDPADPDLLSRNGSASAAPHQGAAVARNPPTRAAAAPTSPAPHSPTPPPLGSPKPTAEQLAKLLKETDVYVKYGLHDKALEHLGKIFSSDPENLDAHEKAYQVYVSSGDEQQAGEQLLNVLRLCTRLSAVDRAQPYLNAILQQNPDHPEVATFVSVLGREGDPVQATDIETIQDDAILVDAEDEEILVAEPPDEVVDLSTDDLALQASTDADEAVDDEGFTPFNDEEPAPASAAKAALPTVIVDASELGTLPPDYALEEDTAEWESANQSSQEPLAEELIPEYDVDIDDGGEDKSADEGYEVAIDDADVLAQVEGAATGAEEPEADSAAEECEEARFFLEQGLLEDARELLETVLIAYPGYPAAQELLARVEREANQRSDPALLEVPPEGQDAFDLAAELASELGEVGNEETTDANSADDFQYSVDDVFAEFKRGLEKVVRPEDVDTHYDLGIAYREMGLVEDAIGEFTIARQGCVGEKKEIDCLTMIALLQKGKGDLAGAIDSYKRALMSEHAVGEMEKALEFELGIAWEDLGNAGKALYHYARVAKLDAQYRDVATIVSRLSLSTAPEVDALPPRRTGGGSSGGKGTNGVYGRSSDKGLGEKADETRADRPAKGKTRKGKAGFV